MTTYRKKLIEVALPLEAINKASAREKSIRHGHPSTLHLWWARRPLAACRAVLFGSLVDDPDSDPMFAGDENLAASKRAELFNLIEELVQWENSNNPRVINRARAEIARCVAVRKIEAGELATDEVVAGQATAHDIKHMLARPEDVNVFLAEHAPPVLDPFCGGGSIPLEAQRLGLRAYASDLNPVPVLITKALIEIPPKFAGRPPVNPESRYERPVTSRNGKQKKLVEKVWHGATGLAEDVRYYGQRMRDEAAKKIGHLYPKITVTAEMAQDRPDLRPYVGQELTIIAWLWARTVRSPSPIYQGVEVPLVRGFWLSKKPGKLAWIEAVVDRLNRSYRFEARTGMPTAEQKKAIEGGTKLGRGCKFRCLLSDEPIPEAHVKAQALAGKLGVRLLAVVAEGTRERVFLSPANIQVDVTRPTDLRGVDAPLASDPRNLWCLGYGLDAFDKLFTDRQLVALTAFCDVLESVGRSVATDANNASVASDMMPSIQTKKEAVEYSEAVILYLALSISKAADLASSICHWQPNAEHLKIAPTFSRHALPMSWDFAEGNPFSSSSGNFIRQCELICEVLEQLPAHRGATVGQGDATLLEVHGSRVMICTDPPYYGNIGYSDLADFFYVWLRRSLDKFLPELFRTMVTPKKDELVASAYRLDGGIDEACRFFEERLGKAFNRMRAVHALDFPLTVFYAFKQAETDVDDENETDSVSATASTGWETMLEGLINARLTVCGTWPMRTERLVRSISIGTNALASSIVLVCRPCAEDAPLATRKEFIATLRGELPDALRNLQRGSIAPVDLAQAAIGPGMAVFTRYSKVMETDGSRMTVRTALGLINQALDEVLAEQEGEFDADTRWALSWFEQYGVGEGPFGVAETLSKAKNTAVNGLVEAGVIRAKGGKVRLVRRSELNGEWDPAGDRRLTVWEATQHLIRTLETDGESGAAALMHKLGGYAETARDLAYRLYNVCERKKWAEEALAYNGLVIAWPELTRLAQAERNRPAERQQTLEM